VRLGDAGGRELRGTGQDRERRDIRGRCTYIFPSTTSHVSVSATTTPFTEAVAWGMVEAGVSRSEREGLRRG
jgi:hypothetical protein